MSLGESVVRSLTSDLKGKNHDIYFDNYFTSTNLIDQLEKDGIYSCGTARKDRRGFPEQLKNLKLKAR